MEPEKDVIQYEVADNGIWTIWLNRPHVKNCVSPQLLRDLQAAVFGAHQPDIVLQRRLDRQIALLGRTRHDLGERRQPAMRGGLRLLRQRRHLLPRGGGFRHRARRWRGRHAPLRRQR